MGYAGKLAQSYSNPDAVWNSLGAVGSTSAWDPSSADLSALRDILNFARTNRITQPTSKADSNAFAVAKALSSTDPTNPYSAENIANTLAGKYMKKYTGLL